MKKERLLNWLFALMVLVAGLNFASCSEDDEMIGGEDGPMLEEMPVEIRPGDDFYQFVNFDWHEGLTNKDVTQGHIYDMAELMAQKTSECIADFEVVQMLQKSMNQMQNGDQDANLERVEEIINDLLAGVETKEDAFKVIGKMIGMGLIDDYAKLYMYSDGDIICYTIAPPAFEEEGSSAVAAGVFSTKHLQLKKLKKYTGKSRSADDPTLAIFEGLGLDMEYFLYAEELDEFIENLENSTVDELKEFIYDTTEAELLLYCGDEYVQQITEGALNSVGDYINLNFTKLFGYSLSHQFSKTYVTEELKEQFSEYGEELRAVFAKRIENNAWLSAQTKESALAKLEAMKFFYGEPNVWYEEGFPTLKGELLVDDILEAKASKVRLIEAVLGKNLREEAMTYMICNSTGLPLNIYNAFYFGAGNTMHIYPAFMMEPEYAPDMDPSAMYAVFYVMGHEMTHGFDIQGSNYDAEGKEVNWWTAEDKAKFDALNAQLIEQISTFEVADGIYADGTRTVGEDVADLGGLNIAFDALNEYLKKKGVSGDELKEAQKKFFEHHAYRYRAHYAPTDLPNILKDSHSVSTVRVNGMFQHMDSWYQLYNVVEGDKLYLPKEERIVIW